MKKFSEVFNFNNPQVMKMFYLVGGIMFMLSALGIIANFFLVRLNWFGYVTNTVSFLFNILLAAIFIGSYIGLKKSSEMQIIDKDFEKIITNVENKKKKNGKS